MPKVFIANQGSHDYSDSARYGEPVFVSKGVLSKFATGIMARLWAEALKDSSPEDFIVSGSLTTLSSIGCSIFARKHGQLNLLMFRNGKYISRRIMLDQLMEEEP